jgi:transposase
LLYNENMKTTAKFPHSHLPMEDLLKRLEMLEKQNAELKAELKKQQELEAKLKWYEEQLRLLQHKRFGVSSEKIHPGQLELFNEVENESNLELPEPTLESIRYQRRRKTRGHREAMLENLPVETVEYRLSDEEQVCSCCGGTQIKTIGS